MSESSSLDRIRQSGPGWREVSLALLGVVCGLGIGLLYGVAFNIALIRTFRVATLPVWLEVLIAVVFAYLPWTAVVVAELQLERRLPGPFFSTLRALMVAPAYAFALGAPSALLSVDLLGAGPPSWYLTMAGNLWLPAIAITLGMTLWIRSRP